MCKCIILLTIISFIITLIGFTTTQSFNTFSDSTIEQWKIAFFVCAMSVMMIVGPLCIFTICFFKDDCCPRKKND